MARFSKEELLAQQREQRLAAEHEHHLGQRHRRDQVELAGRLRHQVIGASQHAMLEALGNPAGVRLVEIKQQGPTGTARTPFQTTAGDPARFVLVPSGAAAPDYATGEEIPLEIYAAQFHEMRARARRNARYVDLPDAPPEVIEREKARAEAELATRLEAIRENLPALTMMEIVHVRLSPEERALIERTLTSGSERERQELLLVRRAVTGPDGNIEAAITLHRWSPEAGRPSRQSLGAGAAVMNLAELRDAAWKRAEASERYGASSLQEFPGFREPVI